MDLLLKGMHRLKYTLWVSETYHTTEVKTAQGASERAKNTSTDTPNGPVSFLEKAILDPFLIIFDPFPVDTHSTTYFSPVTLIKTGY